MIHLAVGDFEVDWGKNDQFRMHGSLFQKEDLTQVANDYVSDDGKKLEELKEGAARPLARTLDRLELMGYTLRSSSRILKKTSSLVEESDSRLSDLLIDVLKRIDINQAAEIYHEDYEYSSFFPKIFKNLQMHQSWLYDFDTCYELERLMNELHPYVTLRLLAENPTTRACNVNWGFADVIEGGWVDRELIVKDLGNVRQFLVVTEGSSDSRIIEHALRMLKPDVADFFSFVDMNEGYPFTGCGNLHRFCQGLVSIGVENRVIIVYDNDATGLANQIKTAQLDMPMNMRAIRLPDCDSFKQFDTIGPNGNKIGDINGRAAAIECYLDLAWKMKNRPVVRWTNFDNTAGLYQGRLEGKSAYASEFLSLKSTEVGYDFSKIERLLNLLFSTAVEIAESVIIDDSSELDSLEI